MKARLLLSIFWTFLKMGPFTFGGGYALIPVIEREIVEKRRWLGKGEVADIVTAAASVPGAVGVNAAAFIGHRLAGAAGAGAALLGILLPAFCILIALLLAYTRIKDHPKVEGAFTAIRATVVALIAYAAFLIGRSAVFDFTTGAFAVAAVALLAFGGGFVHPFGGVVLGAAGGIAAVKIRSRFGRPTRLDRSEPGQKRKEKPNEQEPVIDYMI